MAITLGGLAHRYACLPLALGMIRISPPSLSRFSTVWMTASSFEYDDRSKPIDISRSRTSGGVIGTPARIASRTASVMLKGTVGVRPMSRESVPIVCASCVRRSSILRRSSPSASYSFAAAASAAR